MSTNSPAIKWFGISLLGMLLGSTVIAQSASFNFTAAAATVTGWTNVAGDPSKAVRTVTAPSGVTINSGATANWYPDPTGNACAFNGGGEAGGVFFPAAVLLNHWYVYGSSTSAAGTINVSKPQLILGGLNVNSIYTIKLSGSFADGLPTTYNLDPTAFTVMGASNYGTQSINANANTTDGAVFYNVIPDPTGKIRIYLSTTGASDAASLSGLQIMTGQNTAGGLTLGPGLAQLGGAISLGDSVTGLGPHSFVSNRYQYLNGYQYSFGGSVNDPVNHPVMRLYDNGGFAVGSTLDPTVNTAGTPGMRYYPKMGLLQLGGTDKIDTMTSNSSGPGIDINLDAANTIKGRLYSSILSGDLITLDTLTSVDWGIVDGEEITMGGTVDHSLVIGFGLDLPYGLSDGLMSGSGNELLKPTCSVDEISGYENIGVDTARGSLIGGANNQFGGLWQFSAGLGLTNRAPGGAALGSQNVDFATLPYTGLQGLSAPNLSSYPVLSVGNGVASLSNHSNALTVLYNGRTQINTTGSTTPLSQSAVTPQAALDVVSTNTGVLLPRLNTTQRNGIAAADLHSGLLLYNTDSSVFQYYNGSAWNSVVGVAGGSGGTRWLAGGNAIYDSLDNVAIGTSNSKGYKFAVNGSAIFTRAVVKPLATWPDYVFDEGYRLPGLDEVERYIQVNHHLPGIASEEEVREQGVDVEAQQAALLKKVEELTLYVIGLDKKVKGLQREHDQLKRQGSSDHGHKTK
jgi:hypothetical protein